MIGSPPDHHAVDARSDVRADSGTVAQPAIQYYRQLGPIAFQAMHQLMFERRNLPILLGRQAAENRDARMHDQRIDVRRADRVRERAEEIIVVVLINADSALDRDREMRGIT